MTTPASHAGRLLSHQRQAHVITCEVCGRQVVKLDKKARICGRAKCVYEQRKRRKANKEAQP